MCFAADAEGIIAADFERIAVERRIAERFLVPPHGFLRNLGKTGAANSRDGPSKIAFDEVLRESDSVEDLSAAIGLIR